jgi:carboxylesterase
VTAAARAPRPAAELPRLPVGRSHADGIHISGGGRGCLLLHGFTGTPLEMVPMAEALAEDGYTVHVARLAGHGTSPEDLAHTTWEEWLASAREALRALRARCADVAIVGLSMGGALALHLAATEDPAAVVAMATPIRLRPVLPYVPVIVRVGPRDADVLRYRVSYARIPLAAARDLARLLDRMRELLPRVRAPLLIVQGRRDFAIPGESADEIYRGVASPVRRILWLPKSRHVVTLDRERALLFAETRRFLAEHLARGLTGDTASGRVAGT